MNDASEANLPTPDFSFTPPLRCVAGLRPFRRGGYRLESETLTSSPNKFIIHNYGHGGAGITLSWGSASNVRDLVRHHLITSSDSTVAVLGSGVMGLTVATLLLELGLRLTIYTERSWDSTTSAIAGGQWAASIVNFSDENQFKEILETSYRIFKASIGKGFGVSERPNYTPLPSSNLDIVLRLTPGLLPPRKALQRLPFEHHTNSGFVYQTLLIEPPIFLRRLDGDLRAHGVQFVSRTFLNLDDVLALQENIIVNCTGLGSKRIWNDQSLEPIKGQLALLAPQPQLTYLYGKNGYLFPRTDAVVIGGSYETDFTSEDPGPAFCEQLVDYMKGLFGQGPEVPVPDRHIHHPNNLANIAPADITGV
jgi:D-amino-acid oxidase